MEHDADKTIEHLSQELATARRFLAQGDMQRQWVTGIYAVQQHVLEALAANASLAEVLDALCRAIAAHSGAGLYMILLRSRDRLRVRAVSGLPSGYVQAIDGLMMGPNAASCGTAAYRGQEVVVRDIANSPLWVDYRAQALEHGLRACYSAPILSAHGRVMGTVAVYYRETREPTPHDRQLVEIATRLASIAIKYLRLSKVVQRSKVTATNTARERGTLLAGVSRDLRAPAYTIIDLTNRLLETSLDAAQRTTVEALSRQAEMLTTLSHDLLDFAEIEADTLPLSHQPFSLRQSLGTSLKPLAQQAHDKGLELVCRIQPTMPDALVGDADRLGQLISQVVRDAISHTSEGDITIDIKRHVTPYSAQLTPSQRLVQTAEHTSLTLYVTVHDKRFTMPRRNEPSSVTTAQDPTEASSDPKSISLALAQHLAAMMGGSSWVESSAKDGNTFHCTLVTGLPDTPQPASGQAAQALIRHLPVLVVDDSLTVQQALTEMLIHWEMRPTCVATGQSALAVLQQSQDMETPFALVIIDALLSEMDGQTLARHIKDHPTLGNLPILLTAPVARSAEGQRSQEDGLGTYLEKPIMAPELLQAIVTALTMSSQKPQDEVSPLLTLPVEQPARRVLLADDDLANQTFIKHILEKHDYTVVIAATSQHALTLIEQETFDVVLLELQLPDFGGVEALSALRAREHAAGKQVPIIAMATSATLEDRERCLAMGAEYLPKPFQADVLLEVCDRITIPLPPPSSPAAPAPTIFDYQATLERLDGDTELFQELITLFFDSYPGLLETMRKALHTGDTLTLGLAAHTLKGAVENFAAMETSAAAFQIETALKQGNLEEAREAFSRVEETVTRLVTALATFRDE